MERSTKMIGRQGTREWVVRR
ncbi:hypothetical protein AG1IA_09108 [Rhizoctonia solani AG-1 IA]|uniref:Uncharacterized protein n=1 Tax=Thanatephorus cucumeris (strain AG1-IA) TaxID=983506 RepID=L8WFX6_THACA|nr:hypothetical protein AG1IA_09108 [Rhizoctonia solani AG-1 IA]